LASEHTLELIDIHAAYGRAAPVLRGLSVRVPANTVVCLVGPNGAGKSTVLKVASGLLPPRAGRIVIDGVDVTGRSPQHAAVCVNQGILVHYWSERRQIIRDLCTASGVPVVPGVTGMVVEVSKGSVRVDAPDVPAWFPPARSVAV